MKSKESVSSITVVLFFCSEQINQNSWQGKTCAICVLISAHIIKVQNLKQYYKKILFDIVLVIPFVKVSTNFIYKD